MTKTLIFGGTFDPVHVGHKNLLQSVMAHGYDRAIVIPAGTPPHKERKTADFSERFEKVKAFFSGIPNVTVSDIENTDGKSYTYDTLCKLKKLYPDDKLFLLVGSDMLLYMEKWYNFEGIFSLATIVSAARDTDDIFAIREYKNYLEKKYNCVIIIYDVNILKLSSTQLRSPLVKMIDEHNKAHLTEKRYAHVKSVADYAASLAHLHGVDPFTAYVAGLAHDCTKYLDNGDGQAEYFEKNGIILTEDEKLSPKIHHQISGAHFAKTVFNITDPDILNAIRYHTTGRVGMSKLEKLICLADSIEPRRDFEGVSQMRKMAETDLEGALIMSLDRLIDYVKMRGLYLNKQTVQARDYERKTYGSGITDC